MSSKWNSAKYNSMMKRWHPSSSCSLTSSAFKQTNKKALKNQARLPQYRIFHRRSDAQTITMFIPGTEYTVCALRNCSVDSRALFHRQLVLEERRGRLVPLAEIFSEACSKQVILWGIHKHLREHQLTWDSQPHFHFNLKA